jgi:Rrf2 family protein
MFLSQTGEYALRAVLYLAEHGADRSVQVSEMAQALGLPQNYLSKTLHQLTRAGVLASTRGKSGGFRLAVAPHRLVLQRVVAPFGDMEQRQRCLLRGTQCSDGNGCAAHARWKEVTERVSAFFRETTVADLARGATLPA